MKKTTAAILMTSLAMLGCSKSGGNAGTAPVSPYGTVGNGANSGMFGFWQMDRMDNQTADATGLIHVSGNRVMSESLSIEASHLEIVGFPEDLVHPYSGAYQVSGSTLLLNKNGAWNQGIGQGTSQGAWNVQQPVNGQPLMNGQQVVNGQPVNGQLSVSVLNGNEINLGNRHFHRVTQAQFETFRSNVSQINAQENGNSSSGTTGSRLPPFQMPEVAAHRRDGVKDRNFPSVSMPDDWVGKLAPLPASGFELHISGIRNQHEVYQNANVSCGSNSDNGLDAKFATSDDTGLVEGRIQIPALIWKRAKSESQSVRHFIIHGTMFERPIRIEERAKAGAAVTEAWAYPTQVNGSPILKADPQSPECDLDTKIQNGQMQAQMRCEKVDGQYHVPGKVLQNDQGVITIQFACPVKGGTSPQSLPQSGS